MGAMKDLPTKADILDWVRDNPGKTSKRDIARAFGVKGADRIELKRLMREMQADGDLKKTGRRGFRGDGTLPPVGMLLVEGSNHDGDLFAKPQVWEDEAPPPRILVVEKKGDPALAPGDRFLARLRPSETEEDLYEARLIKKIAGGARRSLGIYRAEGTGGRLIPIDRKQDEMIVVDPGDAEDGELVEAETLPGRDGGRMGLRRARVVERLGDPGAPKAVSLIAIHAHGIPHEFPEAALDEAAAAKPVTSLKGRGWR
ncbi:MAG: hypothetical protein AAGF90_13740 [Pseudomonadota bacterium]